MNERLLCSIYRISSLLTGSISQGRVLSAIMNEVANIFGFSRVAVFLINNQKDLLECKDLLGFQSEERERALENPFRIEKHHCIETLVFKTGKAICVENNQNDLRITALDMKISRLQGRTSMVAVPIKINKVCVGLIEADKKDENLRMSASEMKTMAIFANAAAIAVEKMWSRVQNKEVVMRDEFSQDGETNIVGESECMKKIIDLTHRIAGTQNTTVLIEGETGTGKELIAKMIHDGSDRSDKPYITINCGAISKDLVESELFGYEKGAFTGGVQEGKKGKCELADGGTLLLDEVSELSPCAQVKLLRFLEEREFYPVGGTVQKKVDVRIIAATNKNLEKEVSAGHFRKDLYYRLNVAKIVLPPLRDRQRDVLAIALFFINQFNEKYGRSYKGISKEAQKAMLNFSWPGNVRELRNIIERVVLMEEDTEIRVSHLAFLVNNQDISATMSSTKASWSLSSQAIMASPYTERQYFDPHAEPSPFEYESVLQPSRMWNIHHPYSDFPGPAKDMSFPSLKSDCDGFTQMHGSSVSLEEVSKSLIVQALRKCDGNKSKAAKMLGISRAKAVYSIKKYDLRP